MTVNLYITSTQYFSGKSAICVAFMHRLQKDGYKVGYFKPFSSAARVLAESSIDEDARFFKQAFGLAEPLEIIAPIVLTNQQIRKILLQGGADYTEQVKETAQAVGQDKDVVIMEGSANFREGRIVSLAPAQTVQLLNAQVITAIGYQNSLQVVDDAITAKHRMGDRLVGVIMNNVPRNRLDYVENWTTPYLKQHGVDVLAVLPHEQMLSSISIRDIVETLQAELLCDKCQDALVEHLLIAAMGVDQALTHFRRITNKAVIVGGDRPDIQLAALETSTKALILTGHIRPNPMIQAKADERGVAIILSPYDTFTVVEKVEKFFGKTRFRQGEKVDRFEKMLAKTFDFDKMYQAIGLR